MTDATATDCPAQGNVDRRKSAKIAAENTKAMEGAHWVKNPRIARDILRSQDSVQGIAGAEFFNFDKPDQVPVIFLDGIVHHRKRFKTQKFLSPKAVAEQHYKIMRNVTDDLLTDFKSRGKLKLEDISYSLAIEVVGEILGLTNSDKASRARRIQRVLHSSTRHAKKGFSTFILNIKRAVFTSMFFLFDVKPALEG